MSAPVESSAEKITHYRELRGVTQEEVALALHVTQGSVSQWELGRTSPSRGNAAKLDKFLGAGGEIVAAYGYKMPADTDHPDPTNADLATALSKLQAVVELRLPATDPSNGKLLDVLVTMREGIAALFLVQEERAAENRSTFDEILRRLEPAAEPAKRPRHSASGRSKRPTGRTPDRP